MKKFNQLLALLLVLALALGLAAPAAAAAEPKLPIAQILKMKDAGKNPATPNTLVYPYSQTFGATVIKGSSVLLQYKLAQNRPSSDLFGVMICRGSYDELGYLEESDVVEERIYKMSDFHNGALGMTWKADSRYPVGEYIMIGLILDKNGDPYDDQEYYAVDLYVVSQSIPATGMEVLQIRNGEYCDTPGATALNETCCFDYALTPYVNTADRKVSVSVDHPEILTAYIDAGYVYVTTKGYGWASVTITCGNIKRTFSFVAGELQDANFNATANDPDLCVGMTDKINVTCQPSGTPYFAKWVSMNPNIVTVNNGVVTAVGPGSTRILFSCGTRDCWINYTVTEHDQREGLPVSERTATKPAMQVGPCSICGQKEAVTIIEEAVFTDTDYKAWYSDHVDYVYEQEIMNGSGATTFAPDRTMTRAELVTVLYRIAGSPEVSYDGAFVDIPTGQWYSDAVTWAAQNKIVNGVGNDRFAPTDNITREQIATILYRYTQTLGVEMAEGADLNAYPDGVTVSGFAVDGMAWAVAEGLITGTVSGGVTTLAPKASATRAQLATIISRYQQMFPADSE